MESHAHVNKATTKSSLAIAEFVLLDHIGTATSVAHKHNVTLDTQSVLLMDNAFLSDNYADLVHAGAE